MFNKILVCSDGSNHARYAALLGADIARYFHSVVLALNVFDISVALAGETGIWTIPISQEALELSMASERETAESVLKPIFAQFEQPYTMLQELGHPVDAIVKVAHNEQVDLIVLGSQGLTGLKELLLGSVSYGVLHHAPCPVLIERGKGTPIQRILLASDASGGATNAAAHAFALAKQWNACLTVLNVVEPSRWLASSHPDPNPIKTAEEQIKSERIYTAVKESLQNLVAETQQSYRMHQEQGHDGKTIVKYAQSGGYDLIVMGSRGLGGFERLVLGSTSNYVAHHAHCSVLITR